MNSKKILHVTLFVVCSLYLVTERVSAAWIGGLPSTGGNVYRVGLPVENKHVEFNIGNTIKQMVVSNYTSGDFLAGFEKNLKNITDFTNGYNWADPLYFKFVTGLELSGITDLTNNQINNNVKQNVWMVVYEPKSKTGAVQIIPKLTASEFESNWPVWSFSYDTGSPTGRPIANGTIVGVSSASTALANAVDMSGFIKTNIIEPELKKLVSLTESATSSMTVPTINLKSNTVQDNIISVINLKINLYKNGQLSPSNSYKLFDNSELKKAITSNQLEGVYLYPYLANMQGKNIQKIVPNKDLWSLWVAVYNSQGNLQGVYRLSQSLDVTVPIEDNSFEFQYNKQGKQLGSKTTQIHYGKALYIGPKSKQKKLFKKVRDNIESQSVQFTDNDSSSSGSSGFTF